MVDNCPYTSQGSKLATMEKQLSLAEQGPAVSLTQAKKAGTKSLLIKVRPGVLAGTSHCTVLGGTQKYT